MKKSIAFIVSVAMLVVMVLPLTAAPVVADSSNVTIAYVPLDDRPVNIDRVIYQAESMGIQLLIPDADLYRTVLDEQPLTSSGLQHGDVNRLLAWLQSVETQCDYFVLSLDQLLSGGLVNSRYASNYWDIYSNTAVENSIMNYLISLTERKPVYFFDTLMRLASTAGYMGYKEDEYNQLRGYASIARGWLGGDDLTVENIKAYYEKDRNWADIAYGAGTDYPVLTNEIVTRYLDSRARKLLMADRMIQAVNVANCYYYVGVDDSSRYDSIQTNEMSLINKRFTENNVRGKLFSGTDELGMMALTRCMADHYAQSLKVQVHYYGGRENERTDEFQSETVKQNMDWHLESLGCSQVTVGADVQILCLTVPQDPEQASTYVNNLMLQLQWNLEQEVPTILVDPVSGANLLHERLIAEADVGLLLGYSCWGTGGNAIGIALGQGLGRYLYLKNSPTVTASSHVGQVKALTFSYVKDLSYKRTRVNDCMYDVIWNKQWYVNNFYTDMVNAGYSYSTLCSELESKIMSDLYWVENDNDGLGGTNVVNRIMSGHVITRLNGRYAQADVGNVSLSNFSYPWYRTFEARFDISAGVPETMTCSYTRNETNSSISGMAIGTTQNTFAAGFQNVSEVSTTDLNGVAIAGTARLGTGYGVAVWSLVRKYNYIAVIMTDVDGDGRCTSSDARSALSGSTDSNALNIYQKTAADINGDGQVTSSDARSLLIEAI